MLIDANQVQSDRFAGRFVTPIIGTSVASWPWLVYTILEEKLLILNPDEPLYIDVRFWRAKLAKIAHQYITLYPNLV
jgi:hypothetical protein